MKTTIIFILLTVAGFSQDYVYTVSWCLHQKEIINPWRLQYIPDTIRGINLNVNRYQKLECGYLEAFDKRDKAFNFYNRLLEREKNKDIDSILYDSWVYNVKIDSNKVWRCDSIKDSLTADIQKITLGMRMIVDTMVAIRTSLSLKSLIELWDEYKKGCTAEWRFEKLKRDSVWLHPYSPQWKRWLKREPNVYEFIDKFLRKKVTYH